MTTAALVVRGAAATDLESVLALLGAANLPVEGVPASLADFIVAELDGRLIGVAGLEVRGREALLRSVAVSEGGRSRGVGRAVVEAAISAAPSRGVRDLYLLTTTAEGYFPRFGFRVVGRDSVPASILATDEFRSVCPSSAVAMHLSVGGQPG